jgi:ubiquinone/menaquinone biosynthesis C-methylase UbiE
MLTKQAAIDYFSINAEQYTTGHYRVIDSTPLWRRHHAFMQIIRERSPGGKARILDLGCGPGLLARDLSNLAYEGTGVDAAPGMIEMCRKRYLAEKWAAPWNFELADVENLPFTDNSFDVVTAAGVIEYLRDDEKMLSEAKRVLTPKGILILNVTNVFGYATCLNPLQNPIKSMALVRKAASPVRRSLARDGQNLGSLGFQPRRHRPGKFRETLQRNGFCVLLDAYLGFSIFPAPFCTLLSRLTGRLDDKLDFLDRTPLRFAGASYLVTARVC